MNRIPRQGVEDPFVWGHRKYYLGDGLELVRLASWGHGLYLMEPVEWIS